MGNQALSYPPSIPYDYQVSIGKLKEYPLHKIGRRTNVGTSFDTLVPFGGLYQYLSAETILLISSTSINDVNLTGLGVWAILILGINGSHVITQELVLLNGQTAVATTFKYLRVFRMKVCCPNDLSVYNNGVIYAGTGSVVAGVPENIYGQISIGQNQSQMAMATVPAKTVGMLHTFGVTTGQVRESSARLMVAREGEPFQQKSDILFSAHGKERNFKNPIPIPAKSDIEIQVISDPSPGDITGYFDLVMQPIGKRPEFLTAAQLAL